MKSCRKKKVLSYKELLSFVERKLLSERIRMMYSMVLRKLRCSELEDMYEASRRDSWRL